MAIATPAQQGAGEQSPVMLSGYAALAESAWMGAAQATEVLEPARIGKRIVSAQFPRVPHLGLRGVARREFGVAEAAFILMASFFVSALLGAIRQILFNAQFGAGSEASAYYAAFRLPDTLFSLIAGGALSSAMIPVLLATSREEGPGGVARLSNLALNVLIAAVAVAVLVAELVAGPFVTHVLAPGFDARTADLTITLTRLMLLQPVILAVGSVATALLNSRNQFALTALSVASHNVGLIAGILATRMHPAFGIYGPTWGVVLGAAIQAVVLLPAFWHGGFRYHLDVSLSDRRLREMVALLIPNGLAVGVGYAGFIADTAFASKASQSAALPAIHNAFLLVGLPIALLGQAVGQSVFPRLAASATEARWEEMQRALLRALLGVVLLAVPALLALILLGRPTIHALFQHGKFDARAASLTYDVLRAYAIALPAYVAAEVITRGLVALRDTRTPLLTNSAQLVARVALMALLVGSLGAVAVPRAFAIAAGIETIVLGTILAVKLQHRIALAERQSAQ